jgi:alkylation response protein AidB-like acyl-CoA dehydrogenase
MDLNPSEEQQLLIETFGALYAKESSSERVRAAESSGHDPDLWQRLQGIGALEMAVDEESGGGGASLLDLALVAEQHGRFLGSAPLLEAQVAARLLSRVGSSEARSVLAATLAGDRLTTLALHPPRDGTLTMVPSGSVADTVVFVDGGRLWSLAIGVAGTKVENLGSLPVADIEVGTDAVILASGPEVDRLFEQARDEWLVLMANALAGLATRSLEIGVEYVKERHAFGVPIGSFQAVAHGLADAATDVDGGGLLAREAAWAAAGEPGRAPELAALACAFNAEAAREASYRSLHYHGGYGFMLEFDIQLYFRRAKAWPALFAEPAALYARAEGHRLSGPAEGPPAVHPAAGASAMDFRLGEGGEVFRKEARAFLDEVLTDDVRDQMHRTGVHHNWDFHRNLVERGFLAPGWPEEFGGQGRDPLEMLAFMEEFHRAGAPTYAVGTTLMVANIIRHIGTDEQKQLILPPALGGEIIIVLGFTEPESGSDVAAAQTRAVRDGDQWVVNGQKMFTTNAQEADYVFMLTRTNPDVPKHQGLTTFLVPLRQPGVEIQPVYTLSGERTNLTFYSDVRVDDSLRIGEVDGGWDVMQVSLTLERAGDHGGESIRLLAAMEEWAGSAGDDNGRRRADDPDVRARLGRAAAENEVTTLLCRRSAWIHASGGLPGVEGSMSKLFASEALTRQSADFVDLLGPDGIRSQGDPTALADGAADYDFRFALGTTTYGGTSEVQRNIIAQRGLRLPRSR